MSCPDGGGPVSLEVLLREKERLAKLRMQVAAAELDLKYSPRRRPWLAAGLAVSAGFAVGYFPALRRPLIDFAAGALSSFFQGQVPMATAVVIEKDCAPAE